MSRNPSHSQNNPSLIRSIEADFAFEHPDTFRRGYLLANVAFNDSDWFSKDDDVHWQFGAFVLSNGEPFKIKMARLVAELLARFVKITKFCSRKLKRSFSKYHGRGRNVRVSVRLRFLV